MRTYRAPRSGRDGQRAPASLSVVVPTRDRPDALRRCLTALANLEAPRGDYEVVVVNDGEVPIEPVLSAYRGRLSLTCVRGAGRGAASARNFGAAAASGAFLCFTDDDCEPEPGWLRELERRLLARPDHLVGGRTVNALPDNPFSSAHQWLISFLYVHYQEDGAAPRFFASNNLAVSADGFAALAGFDARFPRAGGEDRDLCDRWLAAGGRLTYVSDAVIRHRHPLTLRTFLRQHYRYGLGAHRFHRSRLTRRRLPEPLSFYGNLVAHPVREGTGARRWLHAALLGLAQGATLAGVLGGVAGRLLGARHSAPPRGPGPLPAAEGAEREEADVVGRGGRTRSRATGRF